MGHCQYRWNQSELYQRTKPGQGVETTCGAKTWPAVDEPEIVPIRVPNPAGSAEAVYAYQNTGKFLPRAHEDPFCPQHGGSPEPPPPPVTIEEMQIAYEAYLQLVDRFERDKAAAEIPALVGVPMPAGPSQVPPTVRVVTEQEVDHMRQQLLDLANRAQAENTQAEVTHGE